MKNVKLYIVLPILILLLPVDGMLANLSHPCVFSFFENVINAIELDEQK